MARYNDIDMDNWKDYSDILTESLWLIDKRDNSGAHSGFYHGNFVPQIPNQLFRRYTKQGDWVLDPFMGSGTSLIEAQKLGRNSIGIELQQSVADEVRTRLDSFKTTAFCNTEAAVCINVGNSQTIDVGRILASQNIKKVQFVILHPPYWDIIHFSKEADDLSNCPTLATFLDALGQVVDNVCAYLENGRYCAVVIGDKYAKGEVIPLGFYSMGLFLGRGYKLKGIIVKNFGETKGKGVNTSIWRYRALANDFYVFKHEYIFVFKKQVA